MVLLIRDEDVKKALTFEDVIQAVEDAYRQHGKGLAQDTERREVRVKGRALLHGAAGATGVGQGLAYLAEPNVVVLSHSFRFEASQTMLKEFPYSSGSAPLLHVIDGEDGKMLAIIHSPYARWTRTGAAGAVGAKYLARRDATTAGIIGTGVQGRAQLLFLSKVRKIDRAFAHSGRRKDEEYAREMGSKLGIDVVAADGPEEVVRNADILTTATRSTEPIVRGEWVREGTHINSVGADDPHKAELDVATFKKANKVVVDSERATNWIGQIAIPIKEGTLKADDIYGTIGEVVAGKKPGRENNAEITIFSSEGTNIQTASVAVKIYQRVKEMGLGVETSTLSPFFMM
jgi:alanine dehydrogenase